MKRFCLAVALLLSALVSARADTTLVFNEIMYHPPNTNAVDESNHEWIELYNQMAVDVDVSGWSIGGDVGFTFPPNSRVPGRGLIVVAASPATIIANSGQANIIGPFTNQLGNNGGTLLILNNVGRIVDQITYGTEGDSPQ